MRIEHLVSRDAVGQIGTFVSLFTGAGGMDIGFYRAGFTPVWANDIDPAAVETYASLFPDHTVALGDIRRQELPTVNRPTLVIGGPPCQGFSVAGKMDPNDPRSRHVWDFLAVVGKLKPKAFVMENVKALAINKRWKGLMQDLAHEAEKRLGYKVRLFVLNASHFGVPQARERMFLIGSQRKFDIAINPPTAMNPPSVREALTRLPAFGTPGNSTVCTAKITLAKNPILRKSPFAGMLFNGQGRPLDLNKPALTLPASMGGNRTPIIDQHQLENGGNPWVTMYHKGLMNGSTRRTKVPKHLRRITTEEASAIQTFPPGMLFAGGQSAKYRQIGNAVPPELAYHVARAVRRALFNL